MRVTKTRDELPKTWTLSSKLSLIYLFFLYLSNPTANVDLLMFFFLTLLREYCFT